MKRGGGKEKYSHVKALPFGLPPLGPLKLQFRSSGVVLAVEPHQPGQGLALLSQHVILLVDGRRRPLEVVDGRPQLGLVHGQHGGQITTGYELVDAA